MSLQEVVFFIIYLCIQTLHIYELHLEAICVHLIQLPYLHKKKID